MPSTTDILGSYAEPLSALLNDKITGISTSFPADFSAQGVWALNELVDYATRPSKRLRGSLAAYTYDKMTGQKFSTVGLQLGVVLELMQNYLLIVDDVMDSSPLRRGKPTVQVLYASAHPDADDHEAQMVAINVGLLAQHIACLVMADIQEKPEHLKGMTKTIHRNIAITGLGQIDDLYQQLGRHISLSDVERKHALKSAYYTFINPLQSGLALAGIDDIENVAIKYGVSAGTAFQIHDDYLGIFGNGAETGKANLDDIREGKYTFFVQYVADHGSATDVAILTRILGNKRASNADLLTVRDIFEQTGALKVGLMLERKAASRAKVAARNTNIWDASFADDLCNLVDYSLERTF